MPEQRTKRDELSRAMAFAPAMNPLHAPHRRRERDASMIVLDHGQATGSEAEASTSEDGAYYAQFKVPDDLMW